MNPPPFLTAVPVWTVFPPSELLQVVGFRGVFPGRKNSSNILRIASSGMYRVWLNDKFVGYGPSRCAKGHFRVDVLDLATFVQPGANLLAFEVSYSNVESFSNIRQPAMVCAELVSDGKVLLATGPEDSGFQAVAQVGRAKRVQRLSFQRTFSEAYRITPTTDKWRTDPRARAVGLPLIRVSSGEWHSRRSSLPHYERVTMRPIGSTIFEQVEASKAALKYRSLTAVGDDFQGYSESELPLIPTVEFQKYKPQEWQPVYASILNTGEVSLFDLGTNLTGFIAIEFSAPVTSSLMLAYDEVLSDGSVNPLRTDLVSLIPIHCEPGHYRFMSAEPYTFRFLQLFVTEGSLKLDSLELIELANPSCDDAHFACSEPELNAVFEASVQTFRQNAVDFYTDCPGRERAGYPCDSFFTARAEHYLCGSSAVEHDFLTNFQLPESFEGIPDGMMPMCYPGDTMQGLYIPQWPMWLILQLEEYLHRSGDQTLIESFRPKVFKFLEWLKGYENIDGLLEGLPGWNFIEWSKANEWVQDVHYPTNMLYANTLRAVERLYGNQSFKINQLKKNIFEQSFDGSFFVDNAMRVNGALERTDNRSEVGQYFALFHGIASREEQPNLWHRLVDGQTSELAKANTFIGNFLRLELLSQAGLHGQVLKEVRHYFAKMARQTGTLWENDGAYASCNHGFASYAAVLIARHGGGVTDLDHRQRAVGLQALENGLAWASTALPTTSGNLKWSWSAQGESRLSLPGGYRQLEH